MDATLGRELFSAFIVVAVMLLVGFPVHEAMHAWTASRLGDNTARWAGRVTLDPRVHFDQLGGIVLGLTAVLGVFSGGGLLFGWAKPTPVNPMNMREGRRGHALVAFAGPASNLVIAAIVAVPLRLVIHNDDWRLYFLQTPLLDLALSVLLLLLNLNIVLFIFNLIPIPPLDGWSVLKGIVPASWAYQMRRLEIQYASVMPTLFLGFVAILFVTGGAIVGPLIDGLTSLLLGLPL
jgi:Zn-dependent protease